MTTKPKSGCGGPIIDGDFSIKNLIKKIGKGPRLAKDLSRAEATAALTQILNETALPEQVGAFLIALRIKSETAEETAGLIDALRSKSVRLHTGLPKLLELAAAHDGKNKNLVISPYVSAILAAQGIPVLLTGGVDVPTKKGVTARHILAALGHPVRHDGESVKQRLQTQHFAYWDVADYCPALEALKVLRTNIGLRTTLNTVEKAINPAQATHLCTGVFHGPYLKDLAEALSLTGEKNVLCLQATEASTDLPLKKRTLFRRVKEGVILEQDEIDPASIGFKREANAVFLGESCLLPAAEADEEPDDLVPDIAKLTAINIEKANDALKSRQGLVYDAIVYNAGVQFWFVGEVDSLVQGIDLAVQVIRTGRPMDLLNHQKGNS